MASIGIGIGIEDPILQVLVLELVLNFGSFQVLVLVLTLQSRNTKTNFVTRIWPQTPF